MKTVTITCDFCKEEIQDEHIAIGSKDNVSLYFYNEIQKSDAGLKKLSGYEDLHFCSKEHFIEFFFHKPF